MISREISVLINEIQVNESRNILLEPAYSVSMSWILTQQCLNLTNYAEMSICWTLCQYYSPYWSSDMNIVLNCPFRTLSCVSWKFNVSTIFWFLACAGGDPFQGKETKKLWSSVLMVHISVQNSASFPMLLLKSSKKVVFLSEISSK